LLEVITLLQASDPIPQQILHVMLRWGKENSHRAAAAAASCDAS